jgi:hypothetical protein
MDPAVVARVASLDEQLIKFVDFHSGMRQRDTSWYTSMGRTVGGSEMAAIIGCNPYSTIHDVIASKVALLRGMDNWGGGGPACWWGVLFEDVIAAYTQIVLGASVRGDEICVQKYPGHRNSPDGYIVACSARNSAVAAHGLCAECESLPHARARAHTRVPVAESDSVYCLWTTDMCPTLAELPRIFLLEFKCPLSRQPTRAVPAQYRPQIWSGLAVSPVAHAGLFVDAVFRKCALSALGPGPSYDTAYNRNSRSKPATEYACADAWGLIGLYAPRASAPAWVQRGKKQPAVAADALDSLLADSGAVDGATVAARLRAAYSDGGYISVGRDSDESASAPLVLDLGSCDSRTFDTALNMFNSRQFACQRLTPCLSDGRGLDLHSEAAIAIAIDSLIDSAPAHYQLLGVLPWKLFHVVFEPVARKAGFMAEVMPIIESVHARVDAAMRSGDPDAYLRAERSAGKKAAPNADKTASASSVSASSVSASSESASSASASDIQDLFGDFKFA